MNNPLTKLYRWNKHKTDFFDNPQCVMQLTKTLLKLDFGLEIELPDDRLCPPVSWPLFHDASLSLLTRFSRSRIDTTTCCG